MSDRSYVLVTPAMNEARYIEAAIRTVVAQTVRPRSWIIVDDGSSDETVPIARSCARRYSWIKIVCRPRKPARNFASKAHAFADGVESIAETPYSYLGNLDADIELSPDYYERMIDVMETAPNIGIVRGKFLEVGRQGLLYPQRLSPDSVPGAVQFFRRACYEEIGGYRPLKWGGIDAAAEIMARERGWSVEAKSEAVAVHLRPVGVNSSSSAIAFHLKHGFADVALGYFGLFQLVRCFGHMRDRPYFISGLVRLIGYCTSRLRGDRPVLPEKVVEYFRREQRIKLLRTIVSHLGKVKSVQSGSVAHRPTEL